MKHIHNETLNMFKKKFSDSVRIGLKSGAWFIGYIRNYSGERIPELNDGIGLFITCLYASSHGYFHELDYKTAISEKVVFIPYESIEYIVTFKEDLNNE